MRWLLVRISAIIPVSFSVHLSEQQDAAVTEWNTTAEEQKCESTVLLQQHDVARSKNAYVWYLADSDPDIACAILVAASAVLQHGLRSNTDLVVIYNQDVPGKERFTKFDIKLLQVKEAASKGRWQWAESFLKLRVAELFQYHRILYFDSDAFPLGSLENLFDIASFPVEIAAPRAYWIHQPFVQSGGPMIIDPQQVFYDRDFSEPMENSMANFGGEMDWVNEHFRDKVDMLDGFYALLIGEWCASHKAYQYWQKHFGQGSQWLLKKAVLVHFISTWKPWKITSPEQLESSCPSAQPELLQVYQKWWDAKANVC